jgi:hypothetical protein
MKPALFESLLQELIDENPFAIRAALRILKVEYTADIPTLAVTCEDQPRLLVNLQFLGKHAKTEEHAKAVVVHEFLHVLLRHTEGRQPITPARHLAFDAVINSIIHRQYGDEYSSMMANYYARSKGLQKLLRPMNRAESEWYSRHSATVPLWASVWRALYDGRLIADDIEDLANTLATKVFPSSKTNSKARSPSGENGSGPFTLDPDETLDSDLLGNHDDLGRELDGEIARAIESALKQMNGHGIWRSPRNCGLGGPMVDSVFGAGKARVQAWEARTLALIRRYITPDRHSRSRREELWSYRIPVLSPADRRSFLRAQWCPFLPDSVWQGQQFKQDGTAQVYLDVSGSMNAEMPMVIALLNRLSRHIRRPFWAFSDKVVPAVIERGKLRTSTTGGTSMQCVLDHVAKTRPDAAIVVTDGYIEPISRNQITKIQGSRLHVLVTRDGNPNLIAKAGLPYTQLEKIPT